MLRCCRPLLTVESDAIPAGMAARRAGGCRRLLGAPPLDMVPLAEAKLPIEGAENAVLACFRQRYGTSVHLALMIGDIGRYAR